jgi:hypothetical protein
MELSASTMGLSVCFAMLVLAGSGTGRIAQQPLLHELLPPLQIRLHVRRSQITSTWTCRY